ERTATSMQIGDVLQYLGLDYLIEGVLTFSADGRGARLYRMFEDGGERFLYAKTGGADPLLLRAAAGLSFDGPPPDALEYTRQRYRLAARASTQVARVGQLGPRQVGARARLYEYTGPGPERLLLLDWGEWIDAFQGERISAH